MNQQTKVKAIKIKPKATRLMEQPSDLIELTPRDGAWKQRFRYSDRLVRNLAVVGCLVLIVTAVRNSSLPETRSIFEAVQASAGMEWDESLGKLSFVNSILPQEIQDVWNETTAVQVVLPAQGTVSHAWSESEPYLMIESQTDEVCSVAEGEVMSVAHGVDEERIVRIRHADGIETIYANLEECFVEQGDFIPAGTKIGEKLPQEPLAFEVRVNGRSVEPDVRPFSFGE